MRSRFRPLWCGLLLLSPVLAALPSPNAHAQAMRAADPATIGQTLHFTLDKNEQKDFAIILAPGKYYIQADIKRVDDRSSNIFANIDLLKTNGALVQGNILRANELHVAARVGDTFTVGAPVSTAAKPLAARLRVKGQEMPLEYWITIQPAARRSFVPFGYAHGDLKPLAIGSENGKGGTLDGNEWAYHTIKLPAGKYNVSLYEKQVDGNKTNIFGKVTLMDAYGVENKNPAFDFNVNEIDVETRKEQRLILIKPQNLIFRVTNTNDKPVEYTLGIEKAE